MEGPGQLDRRWRASAPDGRSRRPGSGSRPSRCVLASGHPGLGPWSGPAPDGGSALRRSLPPCTGGVGHQNDRSRELGDGALGPLPRASSHRSAGVRPRRSSDQVGLDRPARGVKAAATSSSSRQVPTAMPARKPAPRVVASRTGETSTGRPMASARAWTKTRWPTSRRRPEAWPTARPAVGLGRLQQVGAPVGHAFEHGPDQLGAAGAPGDAEQRAPGPEVPHRGAQAEQGRHEPHVAGVGARGGHRGRLGGVSMTPEVVAQPLDAGPGGQHDGLDAPGDTPARCQATMGRCPPARAAWAAGRRRRCTGRASRRCRRWPWPGPGRVQPWPMSEACWSPAMPAMAGRPVERLGRAERARGVDDRRAAWPRGCAAARAARRPSRAVDSDQPGDGGVGGVGHVQRARRTGSRPPSCRWCRSTARPRPGAGRGRRRRRWRPAWWPTRWGQPETLGLERQAGAHRAQVLPADARGHRLAGGPVPHDGGGPLVGDADAGHRPAVGQGGRGHLEHGVGHARRRRPRPGRGGVSGSTGTWWTWSTVASGRTRPPGRWRCPTSTTRIRRHGQGTGPRTGEARPELARVEDARAGRGPP